MPHSLTYVTLSHRPIEKPLFYSSGIFFVGNHLTETSLAASQEAREIAEQKLAQNVFRRQAMAIAVVAILVTIVALYSLKRELDRRLD